MKLQTVHILLCLILISNANILNHQDHKNSLLKEVFQDIVAQNVNNGNGFLLIDNNYDQNLVTLMTSTIFDQKSPIIICKIDAIAPCKGLKQNANIVFTHSENITFFDQVPEMFAPRPKIIIITTQFDNIEEIFEQLWNEKYSDITIIFEHNNAIKILTYNPYLPKTTRIVQSLRYDKKLPMNKLKNVEGAQINTLLAAKDLTKIISSELPNGTKVLSGKDYKTISAIFKHLNAKMMVIDCDDIFENPGEDNPWYISNNNPKKTEVKKKMLREYNLTMMLRSTTLIEQDTTLENAYPHNQNDITIVVPKSKAVETRIQILSVALFAFGPTAMFVCVFFILLRLLIKFIFKEPLKINAIGDTVLDSVNIYINDAFFQTPKIPLEKILVIAWVFYQLLIVTRVKAKITSIFSLDIYDPELDTIDDISQGDFPVFGLSSHVEEIKQKYPDAKYANFMDKIVGVSVDENVVHTSIFNYDLDLITNMGIITEADLALYFSRTRIYRENGRAVFHVPRESLFPTFQCFQLAYGSPFLPIINRKLRQLAEGGFLNLWREQDIFKFTIEGLLYPDENYVDTVPRAKVLDMTIFIFVMKLYIWCIIVSCCAFVCEIVYYYLIKKCIKNVEMFRSQNKK